MGRIKKGVLGGFSGQVGTVSSIVGSGLFLYMKYCDTYPPCRSWSNTRCGLP